MNTRPYTELFGLVEALCGATLATQEATRIKYFINRRAQRAYAESKYWPRFLVVGEERIVSEEGLLPYTQSGLDRIGTVLRIHAAAPFKSLSAGEYFDFYTAASGIQIGGYQATESTGVLVSTGPTDAASPDPSGFYALISGSDQTATYLLSGSTDALSYPYGVLSYVDNWELRYNLDEGTYGEWDGQGDVADPTLATEWAASSGTGIPIFEFPYTAYITYKAALGVTYGDGETDEADFPEEWFEYAAHGAYADFLRTEGQQDRAALADSEATDILMQQLETHCAQGGNHVFTRVATHANTQAR